MTKFGVTHFAQSGRADAKAVRRNNYIKKKQAENKHAPRRR